MNENQPQNLLDMLYRQASSDAISGETGWARLGHVMCAYYPKSKRHSWFIDRHGVTNKRDVLAYLEDMLK